ncbi:MAG TPA: SRPBCC family protein [Thermoleophilaceae bacterium]|nr:SRPBCC family protein [Thermoleophilaceae bacterium]
MAQYSFLTTWLIEAPRERAWDVIEDTLRWPEWWRGVVRVDELATGAADRVGARFAIEWRSRLPYPLEFEFTVDSVERPVSMAGTAVGELAGRGHWRLFEEGGTTAVVYDWQVATTKRWMNLLAPVARPVFEYNHDVVMGWGGVGLARRLGCRLLAAG